MMEMMEKQVSFAELTDSIMGDLGVLVFNMQEIFHKITQDQKIDQGHIEFNQMSSECIEMVTKWKALHKKVNANGTIVMLGKGEIGIGFGILPDGTPAVMFDRLSNPSPVGTPLAPNSPDQRLLTLGFKDAGSIGVLKQVVGAIEWNLASKLNEPRGAGDGQT